MAPDEAPWDLNQVYQSIQIISLARPLAGSESRADSGQIADDCWVVITLGWLFWFVQASFRSDAPEASRRVIRDAPFLWLSDSVGISPL